jgi:hypothetical protein
MVKNDYYTMIEAAKIIDEERKKQEEEAKNKY